MFIELSEKNKRTGRTPIRIAMHEIHSDVEATNKNGLNWKKQYVEENMESANGSPFVVEFLDEDQDIVGGHGEAHVNENGEVYFENSTVVGTIESTEVKTIDVEGEQKDVLVANGFLYEQRVPKFVNFLRETNQEQDIKGSVEIGGKYPSKEIVYEGEYSQEYRVPKSYDYTAMAILFTEKPADDSAVLLEINQYKEEKSMSKTNEQLVSELNEKVEAKSTEINELSTKLDQKDSDLQEVNQKLESKNEELNTTVSTLKEKESELEKLQSEVNDLREYKNKKENEALKSEFEVNMAKYTDDEKKVVSEKIEKFEKEPSAELSKEIVNELNAEVARKIVEERNTAKKEENKSEVNSQKEDIFGDVSEVNSEDTNKSIEDLL